MPLNEQIGLDDLPPDQEIWRFLDQRKLDDLTTSVSLRLARVSDLRLLDERESRLPSVLHDVLQQVAPNETAKAFIKKMLSICEDQALGIFASCWFLPGTLEQEEKMWKEFGGGDFGGIRINSTVKRLTDSIPTDSRRFFGIGRIRYIQSDISYADAFALNQYRSMPFLLKLASYTNEREIRLFERFPRPQWYWDIQKEQPPCTRFRITDPGVIKTITVSRFCSPEIEGKIVDQLLGWRFPQERIHTSISPS